MHNNVFITLDFETTGLSFQSGVTEIVAKYYTNESVKLENLINTLTEPGVRIPDEIVKLNKIDNKLCLNHQDYRDVFNELGRKIDTFINEKYSIYIIAHNAKFEKQFLAWNLPQRVFHKLKFIDTGANYLFNKYGKIERNKKGIHWKLTDACKDAKIDFDESKAHRAEYDVDKTWELFLYQVKNMQIVDMIKHFKEMEK